MNLLGVFKEGRIVRVANAITELDYGFVEHKKKSNIYFVGNLLIAVTGIYEKTNIFNYLSMYLDISKEISLNKEYIINKLIPALDELYTDYDMYDEDVRCNIIVAAKGRVFCIERDFSNYEISKSAIFSSADIYSATKCAIYEPDYAEFKDYVKDASKRSGINFKYCYYADTKNLRVEEICYDSISKDK